MENSPLKTHLLTLSAHLQLEAEQSAVVIQQPERLECVIWRQLSSTVSYQSIVDRPADISAGSRQRLNIISIALLLVSRVPSIVGAIVEVASLKIQRSS